MAFALFDPRLRPCELVLPEGGAPRGAWGRYLDMAVTGAAGLEDRYEARMIDPDMIPKQALARPGEPGTKFDQGATEGQKVVDRLQGVPRPYSPKCVEG